MNEKFHEKMCVIDQSVFYHGSMNILSHSNSSESMIVFRGKQTIQELTNKFGLKKITQKYQNVTGEHSPNSIIYMMEQKLLKKIEPGSCPNCGRKLILTKGLDNLHFGCPNLMERTCNINIPIGRSHIINSILSLKIECPKCQNGYMIYRDGRAGPFLGCDHFSTSGCRGTLDFDDEITHNKPLQNAQSNEKHKKAQFAKYVEELKQKGLTKEEYRERIIQWQREYKDRPKIEKSDNPVF